MPDVGKRLVYCMLVAGLSACRCQPADRLEDKPEGAFPVLAVFLGCSPTSANAELPQCPEGSSPACQGQFYWCQKPDGTRHGSWIRWFPSGGKSLQIGYKDGKRHGAWTQWYASGLEWKRGVYNQGMAHGAWDGWYRNRQQSYHHEYDKDNPTGHWVHWDEKGNVVDEATFW